MDIGVQAFPGIVGKDIGLACDARRMLVGSGAVKSSAGGSTLRLTATLMPVVLSAGRRDAQAGAPSRILLGVASVAGIRSRHPGDKSGARSRSDRSLVLTVALFSREPTIHTLWIITK